MINNGIGISSIAKKLFVGIVVGAAVAFLYVPRSRTGFRSYVPRESARFQRRYQPLSEVRVEKNIEIGNRAKRTIGRLLVLFLVSTAAMISDLKLNKTRPGRYD